MGPVIGSTCWRLTHRRTMKLIEAKDREFHRHIVKNRVDPTAQSATNPVPDFYGAPSLPYMQSSSLIGSFRDRRENWFVEGLQTSAFVVIFRDRS